MSPCGQEVLTRVGTWVLAGNDCDAAEAGVTAPRRERTGIFSLVQGRAIRNPDRSDALDMAAAAGRFLVASGSV
jgi:hypothetical protein